MTNSRRLAGLLGPVLIVGLTGCGTHDAASTRQATTTSVVAHSSTPSSSAAPTPTGDPIGTATMSITGTGTATIRYRINGGPEQTESGAALPWEKDYPVYDKVETTVSAQGGTGCTILMDGNLVSYKTDPSPTCSFAYWG